MFYSFNAHCATTLNSRFFFFATEEHRRNSKFCFSLEVVGALVPSSSDCVQKYLFVYTCREGTWMLWSQIHSTVVVGVFCVHVISDVCKETLILNFIYRLQEGRWGRSLGQEFIAVLKMWASSSEDLYISTMSYISHISLPNIGALPLMCCGFGILNTYPSLTNFRCWIASSWVTTQLLLYLIFFLPILVRPLPLPLPPPPAKKKKQKTTKH